MRGLNLRKPRGPSEWTWKDLGGSARNWEDLWGGPGRICEGIELQEDEGLSGMDPELTWKGLGGSRRICGGHNRNYDQEEQEEKQRDQEEVELGNCRE